jgi:hypothetical protein
MIDQFGGQGVPRASAGVAARPRRGPNRADGGLPHLRNVSLTSIGHDDRSTHPSTNDDHDDLQRIDGPAGRSARTAWFLVFLAGLAWSINQEGFVVVLPGRAEQIGAVLCVAVAGWLALRSNPRLTVGRTWFLLLLAVLPTLALIGPLIGMSGIGAVVRSVRFFLALGIFALISWLWRTDAFVLVRTHIGVMRVMIAAAFVSLALGQGSSFEGRLIAQVPALVPPQVGQFAAVGTGLAIIAAITRMAGIRRNLVWITLGLIALLMSQTRTAMLALLVALAIAVVSLVPRYERARTIVLGLVLLSIPVFVLASGAAQTWFERGQSDDNLSTLTGRTKAWDLVYEVERTQYTRLFGVGYGDKSIQGLPIDSGYIATFHEVGVVGVGVVIVIMAVLAMRALLDPRPANRAYALFLVVYVAVASYTETGIGDISAYVMHIVLAFSVVVGVTRQPSVGSYGTVAPRPVERRMPLLAPPFAPPKSRAS